MKLYFAPMEGITGYVFRNAYAACYGGIDTFFTPFLSNPVLNHIEKGDILPEHNAGLHVVPQILTNRPDTFVAIAETLKDYGYREVNLNLGCPSGTVVAKGRGSGALREPKELDRLLDEIYTRSPLPVSVKTRIGIRSDVEWEDILDVFRKYPVTELIIHPRVQKQFYKGDVFMGSYKEAYDSYEALRAPVPLSGPVPADSHTTSAVKEPSTSSTPLPAPGPAASTLLCYNGDIRTPEDADRIMTEYPRTNALMLGRGLLWDPELGERILRSSAAGSDVFSSGQQPGKSPDLPRLRRFLNLLYEGYLEEMDREGPALMKLKELWSYLKLYASLSDADMRPLWKTKTLAEYRDVVNMLLR